jgi:SAM-dependent methyltransferase
MLSNWVTADDLRWLGRRLGRGELRRVGATLAGGRRGRVERAWAAATRPPTNWWDVPAVRARWNERVSGDPEVDHREHWARTHLAGRGDLVGVSLGCGAGHNERRWARLGVFRRLEGVDLSAPRVESARRAAHEQGLAGVLQFRVGDAMALEGEPESLDVVLAEGSLHHLAPLEGLFERVERLLRPGGWLLVHDFVGPTRMQWTDRQLEAINGLLAVLPERFRRRWDGSSLKSALARPSRLRMLLQDPSEAVQSGAILPLLRSRFDVVEARELGGSVLHMLLSEIAHNFRGDDPETRRALRLCFDAEDLLLESGELASDFAALACRRRAAPARAPHPA